MECADLSEYRVPLEAMRGSPEARCPSEIGHMGPDPVTPGSGPGDLTEFEVPLVETGIRHGGLASLGLCADDPPARWVRSCVELPVNARGWVPEPSRALHNAVHYDAGQQVSRGPGSSWPSIHRANIKLPYGWSLLSYRVQPV